MHITDDIIDASLPIKWRKKYQNIKIPFTYVIDDNVTYCAMNRRQNHHTVYLFLENEHQLSNLLEKGLEPPQTDAKRHQ